MGIGRTWTKEEMQILIDNYPHHTPNFINMHFLNGRTKGQIKHKAREMGLKAAGRSEWKLKPRVCKRCGGTFYYQRGVRRKLCDDCFKPMNYTKVEKECLNCGKKFLTIDALKGSAKYCSKKCVGEAHRGDNYYKKKGYVNLFKTDVKACERCGYSEFDGHLLVIHHINGKKDNGNLMKLCWNCHQAFHKGLWKIDNVSQKNTQNILQAYNSIDIL